MAGSTPPSAKEVPPTIDEIVEMISPEVRAAFKAKHDVALVPQSVFRRTTDSALLKIVRPPTKSMLGTNCGWSVLDVCDAAGAKIPRPECLRRPQDFTDTILGKIAQCGL